MRAFAGFMIKAAKSTKYMTTANVGQWSAANPLNQFCGELCGLAAVHNPPRLQAYMGVFLHTMHYMQ
jgi:hypothetical protein